MIKMTIASAVITFIACMGPLTVASFVLVGRFGADQAQRLTEIWWLPLLFLGAYGLLLWLARNAPAWRSLVRGNGVIGVVFAGYVSFASYTDNFSRMRPAVVLMLAAIMVWSKICAGMRSQELADRKRNVASPAFSAHG